MSKHQKSFSWGTLLKGFCMGCADVVPGVSGGTVALVTGIYDRLVAAVSSVVKALPLLLKFRFKDAFQRVDFALLIPLFSGVFLAIASMARLITTAMDKFPEVTWGLFLGLMVGSVVVVGRMVKDRQWTLRSMMICSTMLAYYITISTPVETSESPGMFFFSGMIAIVAMILPGISGSFLLLIMGKYMQVMGAIKGLGSSVKDVLKALLSSDMVTVHQGLYDIQTTAVDIVIPFALGCAIGLGAFSWILTWLLSNYRQMVISILLGLMIGTLHKLWPFREVTLYLHREGKANKVLQDVAVMPYWDEPMHWMALGMIVLGFFIVLGVERLGSSKA